jgi:hypothetical protein
MQTSSIIVITLASLAVAACTLKLFCYFGQEIICGLLSFFTHPLILVILGIVVAGIMKGSPVGSITACVLFVAAGVSFICNRC